MRSSMVAPPSAVAALQSLHTLPDHTSPSTSNTRQTPRRTLAEHLAEHSPNTSAPARCAVLAEGATLRRGHASGPRERPCSRDADRGAHTRPWGQAQGDAAAAVHARNLGCCLAFLSGE